jgi:NAD kinase
MYKKLVIVTRKTRLQELVERFNTRSQAKFYIEHAGGDFADYEREDDAYRRSLDVLRSSLEFDIPQQMVDRSLVPTFQFRNDDLVVTLGQDGLVANTAKYVGNQPIIAVNPEPSRFDGILLPFAPEDARTATENMMAASAGIREVTLAEVTLNDQQRLLAFNDLFLGARSHVSALYRITCEDKSEVQSSSGVLVATGAGSTGWVSSAFNMAAGISQFCGGKPGAAVRLPWEDRRLLYVVREPFLSRHSQISIVAGLLNSGKELRIESLMPSGGAIFSDGMEADFLNFNSGASATIRAAEQRAHLVMKQVGRGT